MVKHTPTPWNLLPHEPGDKVRWIEAGDKWDGVRIEVERDDCDKEIADANAELIVRAVNAHDALVAALRLAEEEMCRATFKGPPDRKGLNYAIDKARAALAASRKPNRDRP